MIVLLANLKPGVAKTTSAGYLLHAIHERGERVIGVDADPSRSLERWADAAGFAMPVMSLVTTSIHTTLPQLIPDGAHVIIDGAQAEDHAGVIASAARIADVVLVPLAPSGVELERTLLMKKFLEDDVAPLTSSGRIDIRALLNRTIPNATSTGEVRGVLTDAGWTVASTTIPRREEFAASWGNPVTARGTAYDALVTELGIGGRGA
ncbi:hypothetical protein [Streptomyces sp. CAI-85]|uniref:nucleotide-binding protein n=1 Tax=Streptomyces sp. CAI-85 TaxID=1472662 RepID=UPI0015877357|nr:hypothetical protein [Streptomyces sp. CAI-85]NUV64298.1 hypothetical protein [Streptomyces sp. CAI-85]